jgi:hypothetical protein
MTWLFMARLANHSQVDGLGRFHRCCKASAKYAEAQARADLHITLQVHASAKNFAPAKTYLPHLGPPEIQKQEEHQQQKQTTQGGAQQRMSGRARPNKYTCMPKTLGQA